MNTTKKIAKDILKLYGNKAYCRFSKLCIDNTMNPCIILKDFYPQLWSVLSTDVKEKLYAEVKKRWLETVND